MDLDPYALCPCGAGKKLKFCCCRDILSELARVLRMLDGDQRLAALERIDKLLVKYPDRAALLSLKATVELELNELEKGRETVARLLEVAPDNPVGLAHLASMKAAHRETRVAVELVQRAIEETGSGVPYPLYDAIENVANALLLEQNVLGARGHLLMLMALDNSDDQSAASMYMRINAADDVPLLLKDDHPLLPCPENVSWKKEFEAAIELANSGAWLASAHQFKDMSLRILDEPVILRNLAVLRGRLGDLPATVAALRAYAALKNVDLDDAVEAEALAQLLDTETADIIDQIVTSYPVRDVESVMESLLSDRRLSGMSVDPTSLVGEDEPPPKGIFWLLDRPLPETGVEIQREDVPRMLGNVMLFGKQTDRAARVEFSCTRTADFDARVAVLKEVVGEQLEAVPSEHVIGHEPAVNEALSIDWRLPDDTPPELRHALVEEQRRINLMEIWPGLEMKILDGNSPRAAVEQAQYRVRVLAAILLLELAGERSMPEADLNDLRRSLNLPTRDPIDPTDVPVKGIPAVRVGLVMPDKLSDDDLLHLYRVAATVRARTALRRLGLEIIGRPQLDNKIPRAKVFRVLAGVAKDTDEALQYLHQGRHMTVKAGESPAYWLIDELSVRIERRESEEIRRVLGEIQTRHMNEPGVGQALLTVLTRYGLVRPDGSAGGGPEPPEPALAAAEAPAPAGQLWTPGGESAASSEPGGEEPSKLWVPGMD